MALRLFVDLPLADGAAVDLPGDAARHAQVRRVQPGDALMLFDGSGREWPAAVTAMGRGAVAVRTGAGVPVDRELQPAVLLAVGMPANDRMDALVEKAAELGMAGLQPLQAERSVLRLDAARAERRRLHWQAVAVAACEQCGRARVPPVQPVRALAAWLATLDAVQPQALRLVLAAPRDAVAAAAGPQPLALADLRERLTGAPQVVALSGPEGGLSPAEEDAAARAGFLPLRLGPRVLRADTAPLALLAALGALAAGG